MRVIVNQFAAQGQMHTFPLAAGQIIASARTSPVLSDTAFEIETQRRSTLAHLERFERPDVLAFSLYVWNLRHSLAVARAARAEFPVALIVCGGPSVPRDLGRARAFLERHEFIDVLVFGEGEITFRELLCRRSQAQEIAGLAGTAVRVGADVTFGPPRSRIEDFAQTASPYVDGTFDEWLRTAPKNVSALLETNRGCPFRCTFCDWGQATASRVNDIPIDRVYGEIQWLAERHVPYVYIIDANFGIRRRDPEIVEHLARSKRTNGAPLFCYFHLTKNATVRNLATVEALTQAGIGCHIAISMQSLEPKVLEATERDNIHLEVYKELCRTCAERGIPTANELILGLPEQTLDGFVDGIIEALSPWPNDSFFLYPARLLENSAMASDAHRERYALQTRMCTVAAPPSSKGEVEFEEVVVATSTLSLEQWQEAFLFGSLVSAFYNLHAASLVLHFLRMTGRDVRGWIEAVVADVHSAPRGSVFAAIRDDFFDLVSGLIAENGALRMQRSDLPNGPWEAHELICLRIMMRYETFCDELHLSTRHWAGNQGVSFATQLDELFAVQRLAVPSCRRRHDECLDCEWDWAAWWRDIGTTASAPSPEPRRLKVTLHFRPAAHLVSSKDEPAFLASHLAQVYAKQWRPELEVAAVARPARATC